MGDSQLGPKTSYNFTQLQQLWTNNGGPPGWAPLMAGIAIAESGGNAGILNNTPATGDYSVGLWQINYFANLLPGRTAEYGSPQALANDPNLQAKAAISLFGGGPGISNWKGDATFNAWTAAGSPSQPSANTVSAWLGGAGSGPPGTGAVGPQGPLAPGTPNPAAGAGLSTCVIQLPGFLFFSGPCFLTKGGVKWLSGVAALGAGTGLFVFGVVLLASSGFGSPGAKEAVGKVAKTAGLSASLLAGPEVAGAATIASKAGGASKAAPAKRPAPANSSSSPPTAGRVQSRQIERRYEQTQRDQGPIGPRGGNPTATRVASRERRGTSVAGPGSSERRRRASQPF